MVSTPVVLIAPFKAQTPSTMQVSFSVGLWRGGRWWSRAALVILLLPALAATWLARQNHFEWIFNPLPNPAYAKAAEASFVNNDDRVLAVTIFWFDWRIYHPDTTVYEIGPR